MKAIVRLALHVVQFFGLAVFVVGLAVGSNAALTAAQERSSCTQRLRWVLKDRAADIIAFVEEGIVARGAAEPEAAAAGRRKQDGTFGEYVDEHRMSVARQERALASAAYGAMTAVLGLLVLLADVFYHVRTRRAAHHSIRALARFTEQEQQLLTAVIVAVAVSAGGFMMFRSADSEAEALVAEVQTSSLASGISATVSQEIALLEKGTLYLRLSALAGPAGGVCFLMLWILIARGGRRVKAGAPRVEDRRRRTGNREQRVAR